MTRTHNQWIAPVGAFAISTGGLSRTTILKRGGIPIARFYADRFDQALLDLIVEKLNAGWLPIESAPTDGERIILCWHDDPVLSDHVELGMWKAFGLGVSGWANTYGKAFSGSPTHWRALPAPLVRL